MNQQYKLINVCQIEKSLRVEPCFHLPEIAQSAKSMICCSVTRRLVESVGGAFGPVVSPASAVLEHAKEGLAEVPYSSLKTRKMCRMK